MATRRTKRPAQHSKTLLFCPPSRAAALERKSCSEALGVASPVRQQQPLGAKEQMAFSIQALSEAAKFDEEKLERAI